MENELRESLIKLHKKLALAVENEDAPWSLGLDEMIELCGFMELFLYD